MGLGVPGGKVRKGKRRGWEGQENEGKASRGEEGKFHTTIFSTVSPIEKWMLYKMMVHWCEPPLRQLLGVLLISKLPSGKCRMWGTRYSGVPTATAASVLP